MADTAYMQYEYQPDIDPQAVARWHGGEYIALGWLDGGDFHALDVINVWDYAAGKPRIPFTLDAMRTRVDERLAEDAETDEDITTIDSTPGMPGNDDPDERHDYEA